LTFGTRLNYPVTEVSRSSHSKLAVMFGGLFLASCTAYDIGPSAYYPSEGYYPGYSYHPYGFPTYGYPAYGQSLGLWGGGGWEDTDRWRGERSDNHDRDHQANRHEVPQSHSDPKLHQAAPQARAAPQVHQMTPQASATAPNHAGQKSHEADRGHSSPRGGWQDQRQPH